MLSVNMISKRFGDDLILNKVSFQVNAGFATQVWELQGKRLKSRPASSDRV